MVIKEIDPKSQEGKRLLRELDSAIALVKNKAKELGLKSTEGILVDKDGNYTGMDFN